MVHLTGIQKDKKGIIRECLINDTPSEILATAQLMADDMGVLVNGVDVYISRQKLKVVMEEVNIDV